MSREPLFARFTAYWPRGAPHLDTLAQRAGLPPEERLTDLEPMFADRFPFEPARYETVPDELPGLWPSEPDEPDELMVPAI